MRLSQMAHLTLAVTVLFHNPLVATFVGERESLHRSSNSRQTMLKELSWQQWVQYCTISCSLGTGSSCLQISHQCSFPVHAGVVRKSYFLHSPELPSILFPLSCCFLRLPWTAGITCYFCWCIKISTATATSLCSWPHPFRKWSFHSLTVFRQSEIEGTCSHTPLFDSRQLIRNLDIINFLH